MNNRNDWLLIATLAFVGVSLLGLAYPPAGAGLWNDVTAAWVQAIGSVAAILVAVAVPAYQRRSERKISEGIRKLRARSLAVSLEPILNRTRTNGTLLIWHLRTYARTKDMALLAQLAVIDRGFRVPSAMSKFISELYILGSPMCIAVQLALKSVADIDHTLDAARDLRRNDVDPTPFIKGAIESFEMNVAVAVSDLEIAVDMIQHFDENWE